MLIDNSSFTYSFKDSIIGLFRNSLQQGNALAGRTFQIMHSFASHLLKSNAVANTVFVISNTIFLSISHVFAKEVNHHTQKYVADESERKKNIHCFFVDGVVFGGSFTALSYLFSRATPYPLHPTILAAIAITAIAARIILRSDTTLQTEILANRLIQEKLDLIINRKQRDESGEEEEYNTTELEDRIKNFKNRLEETLTEHQQTIGFLNSSLKQALSQKKALEEIQDEAYVRINELTIRLEEAKTENQRQIETQSKLNDQILQLQEAFRILTETAKTEREQLEKEIKQSQSSLLNIEKKLEIKSQEINLLTKQAQAKEANFQNEQLKLQEELGLSHLQNKDLTAQLTEAQKEIEQQKHSLEDHKTKAQADILKLEHDIEDLTHLLETQPDEKGRTSSHERDSEQELQGDHLGSLASEEKQNPPKKRGLFRRLSGTFTKSDPTKKEDPSHLT